MSGKAQQMLRARQLDRCDQYREDLEDGLIVPVVQMLLRICSMVQIRSAAIRQAVAAAKSLGAEPGITLKWGAYYAPEPAEEKAIADFLAAADKVVALPTKLKLQKLARALDIENVDALLAEIEAEQAERDAKQQAQAEQQAHALAKAAHGDGPVGTRDPRGAGAHPPKAAGVGGAAAAAAPAKDPPVGKRS
jgi:hypothetical protein